MVNVFKNGDTNKISFESPIHEIMVNKNYLENFKNDYLNTWDEISSMKTSILINSDNSSLKENNSKKKFSDNYLNSGTLQEICLNLPRFAYATKEETKFFLFYDQKKFWFFRLVKIVHRP